MHLFRTHLLTDWLNGVPKCYTETKTRVWAAFLDLDFDGVLSPAAQVAVARVAHGVVCAHFPHLTPAEDAQHMRVVVCSGVKDAGQRGMCTGMHIVWPSVCVDLLRQVALALAIQGACAAALPTSASHMGQGAAAEVDEAPPPSPGAWDDIVDLSVYRHACGLRLPYCPKPKKCGSGCTFVRKHARGAGVARMCPRCIRGFAPDPKASVYVPYFVLAGRQGGEARAALEITAHATSHSRNVSTVSLLAMCSIRRPGVALASPGFVSHMQAIPPALCKSLLCAPSGAFVPSVTPFMNPLMQTSEGPRVLPASPTYRLLERLVRQSYHGTFADVVMENIFTFVDSFGRVVWYQIAPARNDASMRCQNVAPRTHRSAQVYFAVAARSRSLTQRCTCGRKHANTNTGLKCSEFTGKAHPLRPEHLRALFPHEPLSPAETAAADAADKTEEGAFLSVVQAEVHRQAEEVGLDMAAVKALDALEAGMHKGGTAPLDAAPLVARAASAPAPLVTATAPSRKRPREDNLDIMIDVQQQNQVFLGDVLSREHLLACLTHQQYAAAVVHAAKTATIVSPFVQDPVRRAPGGGDES
jgi:hypothetical protein